MATYELTSPQGEKYRVSAPDDATESQVMEYFQANLPKPDAPKSNSSSLLDKAKSYAYGAADTATFGLADEATSALGAAIRAPFSDQSFGDIYDQRLDLYRQRAKEAQQASPISNVIGSVGGAITGAGGLGKLATQLAPNTMAGLAKFVAANPFKAGALTAGASGALSGFGMAEGGLENRATSAAITAPIAAVTGGLLSKLTAPSIGNEAASVANELGIGLPAGAATGSRTIQALEQGLATTPGGVGVIGKAYQNATDQLGEAVSNTASKIGRPLTKQGAGEKIVSGATKAIDKFQTTRTELDNAAESIIGTSRPASLNNIKKLRDELTLVTDKKSRNPEVIRSLSEIKNILDDADKSGINYQDLRKIRTRIGQELDKPSLADVSPADEANLRRLYGAIRSDLYDTAATAGDDAVKALSKHDRYVRYYSNTNQPVLKKIIDQGTDESAFNYAITSAQDGGSKLQSLKRSLPKNEWDDVSATVLANLGRPTAGNQGATALGELSDEFSVNTFLTNYNKMSPEARKVLWKNTRYDGIERDLDSIVKTAQALKDPQRYANTSKTAGALAQQAAIYGGIGFLASGGDTETGLKVAAGSYVAPYAAAKLMTNPKFVRWLAKVPNRTLGSNIDNLQAISSTKSGKQIAPEIKQYIKVIKQGYAAGSLTAKTNDK